MPPCLAPALDPNVPEIWGCGIPLGLVASVPPIMLVPIPLPQLAVDNLSTLINLRNGHVLCTPPVSFSPISRSSSRCLLSWSLPNCGCRVEPDDLVLYRWLLQSLLPFFLPPNLPRRIPICTEVSPLLFPCTLQKAGQKLDCSMARSTASYKLQS